jgi:hypothetical protein
MGTCRDVVEYIEANAARGGLWATLTEPGRRCSPEPPPAVVPGLAAVAGLSSSADKHG